MQTFEAHATGKIWWRDGDGNVSYHFNCLLYAVWSQNNNVNNTAVVDDGECAWKIEEGLEQWHLHHNT